MNKLNFSDKELDLVKYYSAKQPLSRSIAFFFSVLAAPVGFAIYGAFNKDAIALTVAFIGLFIFILWYIFASMKNEEVINSLCNKILKNELS